MSYHATKTLTQMALRTIDFLESDNPAYAVERENLRKSLKHLIFGLSILSAGMAGTILGLTTYSAFDPLKDQNSKLTSESNALKLILSADKIQGFKPKLEQMSSLHSEQSKHSKDSFTYKALQEKLDKLALEARKELGLDKQQVTR